MTEYKGAAKRIHDKFDENDGKTPLTVLGNFLSGHVKEMLAVITFLLCWSRVGRDDFLAFPAILYVVLITYCAPILNPILFWALRLGPYLNTSSNGFTLTADNLSQSPILTNTATKTGMLRTVASLILIPGFQILGVLFAALIKHSLMDSFGTETLVGGGGGVSSMRLYSDPYPPALPPFLPETVLVNGTMRSINTTCSKQTAYPYEKNSACVHETGATTWNMWFILEEATDTFFFCWAIFYLYEQGEYLLSKQTEQEEEENPTKSPGVYQSMQIALVALGLCKMFPTAHHGWHITLYWYFLQNITGHEWYTTNELNMRLLGGFIGFLAIMFFYYILDLIDMLPLFNKEDNKKSKDVFSKSTNTWLYAKIDQRQRV